MCIGLCGIKSYAQHSTVAKLWTNEILFAITNDFARPPIHARNLFHLSIAMHDAWAAYDQSTEMYFLGKTLGNFTANYQGIVLPQDIESARHEAISYAAYRLINHRFQNSPKWFLTQSSINQLMNSFGYNTSITSTDYINGGPAELGNYIANRLIAYGFQDGSNEINNYANQFYQPVQGVIRVEDPGNPNMTDPNRWQAISLSIAIDQAGNVLSSDPPHLAPEWGNVRPFALADSVLTVFSRDGNNYRVYHNPGAPVYLDTLTPSGLESLYKWNFTMVSVWQSHLDPTDGVMWDVSPASIGNNQVLPEFYEDYENFYDFFNGGDIGPGYDLNPVTNQPYAPQIVPRGDYTRVVAEFWADGLDSETPPGHWFKIYNEVSNHPLYQKKWMGQGPVLDDLHYDVKAYLTLGGAMHDAAISAWGVKGWYDYVRPVSALRYMADRGQSSDSNLPNYHPAGIPLIPGYVELVEPNDPLAGTMNEHVGKIKLYTWRGPDFIGDPEEDFAGVGWILAENWWPYQRPTFVTPPFAGFVSGHSTYSRAAAEVMTFITGNPFFPGGMSNFVAEQNEFLEFEQGPSVPVVLQWATYRDASDQCSLSRIWGGIHPAVDDIPGRFIGMKVGVDATVHANKTFDVIRPEVTSVVSNNQVINLDDVGTTFQLTVNFAEPMNTSISPVITFLNDLHPLVNSLTFAGASWLNNQTYVLNYNVLAFEETLNNVVVQVAEAINLEGVKQKPFLSRNPLIIDKDRPTVASVNFSNTVINDDVAQGMFSIQLNFSERCDTLINPSILFVSNENIGNILTFSTQQSGWISEFAYLASYAVADNENEIANIGLQVEGVKDLAGNIQSTFLQNNAFSIDTRNPLLTDFSINKNLLSISDIGNQSLIIELQFDKSMQSSSIPALVFQELSAPVLTLNTAQSSWLTPNRLRMVYNLQNQPVEDFHIDISLQNLRDLSGNRPTDFVIADVLSIDTKRPVVASASPSVSTVSDLNVGIANFKVLINFDEAMNQTQKPVVEFFENGTLNTSVNFNIFSSNWIDETTFEATYNVVDLNVEIESLDLRVNFARDFSGNAQSFYALTDVIAVDTKNPSILSLSANTYQIASTNTTLIITAVFDEPMDQDSELNFDFQDAEGIESILVKNEDASQWINPFVYILQYDLQSSYSKNNITIRPSEAKDLALNEVKEDVFESFFSVNINPLSLGQTEVADIVLFPNPVQGNGNLFIKTELNKLNFKLYNSLGQKVLDQTGVSYEENGYNVKLSNLSPGVYNLYISEDGIPLGSRLIVVE